MTDFKAKMHQIRFRIQRSPRRSRPPSWIWRALLLRRGKGRGGEGTRGEGKGGEGRGGEGKERAMSPPPHYLEEVYAYVV